MSAPPGDDLVRQGLRDLVAGVQSVPALLVAQATTRLRAAGVPVPEHDLPDADDRMYRLLCEADPAGGHATFRALRALLVSYCQDAEAVQRRLRAARDAGAAHETNCDRITSEQFAGVDETLAQQADWSMRDDPPRDSGLTPIDDVIWELGCLEALDGAAQLTENLYAVEQHIGSGLDAAARALAVIGAHPDLDPDGRRTQWLQSVQALLAKILRASDRERDARLLT